MSEPIPDPALLPDEGAQARKAADEWVYAMEAVGFPQPIMLEDAFVAGWNTHASEPDPSSLVSAARAFDAIIQILDSGQTGMGYTREPPNQ
jgi:hypothetical protein